MAAGASPLEHAFVLDFTRAAGAPDVAFLLGLLGARVIRIESPLRAHLAKVATGPSTTTVRLDVKDPRGIELALGLAENADVAVADFRPGVLEGLGQEVLRARNDRLVVVSVSAAGTTAPETVDGGCAPILAALGGLAQLTGYPDGPPAELRQPVDSSVGLFVALAAVAGLLSRVTTGRGVFIDVSAREVVALLVGDACLDFQLTGRVPLRTGNEDVIMAPYGVYRCRGPQSWISVAVETDDEWRGLACAIGRSELADAPELGDGFARWERRTELDELLEAWTRSLTPLEAATRLQEAGVPAAPSSSPADLLEGLHLAAPWELSKCPSPAPQKDTGRNLFEELLGLDPERIAELEREGIIG